MEISMRVAKDYDYSINHLKEIGKRRKERITYIKPAGKVSEQIYEKAGHSPFE